MSSRASQETGNVLQEASSASCEASIASSCNNSDNQRDSPLPECCNSFLVARAEQIARNAARLASLFPGDRHIVPVQRSPVKLVKKKRCTAFLALPQDRSHLRRQNKADYRAGQYCELSPDQGRRQRKEEPTMALPSNSAVAIKKEWLQVSY